MTNPLRKERIEGEQLTTDDIAHGGQSKGPEAAKPVRSEGAGTTSAPEKRKITSMSERDASAFPQSARGPELGATPSVKETGSRPATETQWRDEDATPLFAQNETEDFRRRWNSIQASFVDEPRKAVEQADGLVAATMKRLAEVFAQERSKLEQQWDRGDKVSTEDLRVALQRYRAFFHRLLAV